VYVNRVRLDRAALGGSGFDFQDRAAIAATNTTALGSGDNGASLQCVKSDAGNTHYGTAHSIFAGAGSQNKTLLDSTGASSWQFAASDVRMKQGVVDFPMDRDGVLGSLRKLRGVEFEWKKDQGPTGRRLGFIAQEVREVLPAAVVPAPDEEHLGIDSLAMHAFMLEALKRMDERLTAIEQRMM
jgi:hypothetical protein